jgi:general secretion pathway protein C
LQAQIDSFISHRDFSAFFMIDQRTLLTGGQLFLLALAALFAATTVNGVVASRLARRPTPKLADPPPAAPVQVKRPQSYYAAITEKDIFNPPRPVAEAAPVQVSELKAKLLGTAPGHGMESFAIIEDQTNKKQELYRVGDKLQGRAVHRIEWDRVVLKNGDREEILKLAEGTGLPGAPEPPTSAEGVGIQARGENDFLIERAEVDKAMENMNQLFTQMRAVPHFQDGKAAGFRLFAIRRDSIFDKIGLKNGDIINKVNGNELTDPARAMALIQELRNEGRVSVDVTRNREPTTLNYEIR